MHVHRGLVAYCVTRNLHKWRSDKQILLQDPVWLPIEPAACRSGALRGRANGKGINEQRSCSTESIGRGCLGFCKARRSTLSPLDFMSSERFRMLVVDDNMSIHYDFKRVFDPAHQATSNAVDAV